jgi:hypothetical protein
MAGDGKTGTSTYAWAARELGLATGHWDEFLCPDSMGIAECTRREHAWTSFRRAIWALKPSELATFDYCGALKDLDAVADVPIAQLLPFLYAAHEDARVVLTVQNSVEWYRQRAQEHHGVHAAPFYWMTERSLSQIYPIDTGGASLEQLERRAVQSPSVASVGWAASQYGLGAAWSYVTEMALTMCTVPPSRNLRQASRTRSRAAHDPAANLCHGLALAWPREHVPRQCHLQRVLAYWSSLTSLSCAFEPLSVNRPAARQPPRR